VLVTARSASLARRRAFAAAGVEVWALPDEDGRIELRQALAEAARQGMTSLLLEGGGRLAAGALRERLVDQVRIFVAPLLLGAGVGSVAGLGIEKVDAAVRLEQVRLRRVGSDLLYTAEVRYPCSPD
jgi:diaminohydroxyphosphoribosylaminopyrimidine deaminase/5-amino-6-(5-phosphoribosylamino)uracil reductase